MNCIFCKGDAAGSRSIEHIIPESLGNTKNILPRGTVCDACNNYFAVKVEKPLLDSDYFTHTRFRNIIPNKRGNVPSIEGLYEPPGIEIGMHRYTSGYTFIAAKKEADEERFIKSILTHNKGMFTVPIPAPVSQYLVSRFLAKVGLEVLTQRVMNCPGWEEAVVFRKELDEFRVFARYGDIKKRWSFYERRLYEEHQPVMSSNGELEEILNEYTLLYTSHQELYAVIAILGVEYTINLCGPEIDGYIGWLEEHEHGSPLYP